ncbi:hypothetical protein IGJ34_000082 [Enterococcus sp. AZ177]
MMVNNIIKVLFLIFVVILPFISYRNLKIEATGKKNNAYYFWKILFIVSIIILVSLIIPTLIYFIISR